MPSALERRRKKDIDQFFGVLERGDAATEARDIGFVVRAAHLGVIAVVQHDCADTPKSIRRHAHADAGTADEHRALSPACRHRARRYFRKIGIIGSFFGMGTAIDHRMCMALEVSAQRLFEDKSCVIGCESYFHMKKPPSGGLG